MLASYLARAGTEQRTAPDREATDHGEQRRAHVARQRRSDALRRMQAGEAITLWLGAHKLRVRRLEPDEDPSFQCILGVNRGRLLWGDAANRKGTRRRVTVHGVFLGRRKILGVVMFVDGRDVRVAPPADWATALTDGNELELVHEPEQNAHPIATAPPGERAPHFARWRDDEARALRSLDGPSAERA